MKEFAISAAYLRVCFSAITYLKSATLQAHDIVFAPFGFAAAKASICAKFMSLGHMVHLGDRYQKVALIWPTLHKSVVFLVLLLLLDTAEEVIVGLLRARPIIASLAEVSDGTRAPLIARSIVGLLISLPFFALRELGHVVGERTPLRLYFEPRRSNQSTTGDVRD